MHPYIYNLSQLFRQTVETHRSRPAIRLRDGQSISYLQLDEQSNNLAAWLLDQDIAPRQVVAILHDKSPLAYAFMIACLKTGIIYTNLDPDSPWERVRKILRTCEPQKVINFVDNLSFTEEIHTEFYTFDAITDEAKSSLLCCRLAHLNAQKGITGNHPAYIMFTSGSTGTPKGAVMTHANLINFVQWARTTFKITSEDVLTSANPMYFDNSVFDFYASLFSGASLLPLSASTVREPRNLVKQIGELGCTVWFSVPSLLVYLLTTRALGPSDFPTIRKIIFGGEGFPKPKLKELFDLFQPRIELENVYGPTECTCICSSYQIQMSDFDDMQSLATLGYLAPNFGYEIIPQEDSDPNFGELFLTGPQVGLGYFNDSERTNKSFVQNPLQTRFTDRGYRTGDLVRRDTEGKLHFKGRVDFQIKHMGYRIELEEIEAALSTLPSVKECAVVYQKLGIGVGQIHGFAALNEPQSSTELGKHLAKLIPPYMLPKHISILPELPKNANGKIDRVALLELLTGRS
jgi:D-alanine--poly(phosphoribitol) ligase subunit 1